MPIKTFASVELAIGNTPIIEVRGLREGSARVFLKLEQFNPGGSIKDRIARTMIAEAERRGQLKSGMSIVESSSGNTAIGLAMLSAPKGYQVYAICDRNVPLAKLGRIKAYCGHIVYLPATPAGFDSVELRIALADRLAATVSDCISLRQFSNPDNPKAHYDSTGPEIWQQTEGRVSAVVAAVGTCGTATGIGRFLKERRPSIKIFGAEPVGSTIFGGIRSNFLIQGGGLSFVPPILDRDVVDNGFKVSDEQAIKAIYWLARTNGLMVGGTSGWVLHTIFDLAETCFGPEHWLVGILPDGGDRYIDTVYNPNWLTYHRIGAPQDDASNRMAAALGDVAVSHGCSIDGWDEAAQFDIRDVYHRLEVVVPEHLLELARV